MCARACVCVCVYVCVCVCVCMHAIQYTYCGVTAFRPNCDRQTLVKMYCITAWYIADRCQFRGGRQIDWMRYPALPQYPRTDVVFLHTPPMGDALSLHWGSREEMGSCTRCEPFCHLVIAQPPKSWKRRHSQGAHPNCHISAYSAECHSYRINLALQFPSYPSQYHTHATIICTQTGVSSTERVKRAV